MFILCSVSSEYEVHICNLQFEHKYYMIQAPFSSEYEVKICMFNVCYVQTIRPNQNS